MTFEIQDIEDFEFSNEQREPITKITKKSFKNQVQIQENTEFLPGNATIMVKTWGCSHNNSDGEYMAGLLAEQGYQIVLTDNKAKDADLWVLNSCTVKGPSEQTFANDIQKGLDAGKKIIVAGCVPQADKNGIWKNLTTIGVQQIDQIVYAAEQTLQGNTVKLLKQKTVEKKKVGIID